MHATLLGVLGLALLGALHAQDSIPVQTDFQQDKVTLPGGLGRFLGDPHSENVRRWCCRWIWGQAGPDTGRGRAAGAPAASPSLGSPRLLGLVALEGTQDPGSSLWDRTQQMWGRAICCAMGRL